MLLVFSLLLFFLMYMYLKKDKGSPLTVFLVIWTTICFLYGLHLYKIVEVSFSTELTIILGISFFIIGYLIANSIKINGNGKKLVQEDVNSFFLIKTITIFDYIYVAPIYLNKIFMIFSSGWSVKNAKLLLGEGNDVFTVYFFDPFNFFLVALTVYLIIYKRKEKFLIFSGLFLNILFFMATGSRARLIFFVLAFAVMALTDRSEYMVKIKSKVKYILLAGVGIVITVSGYGMQLFKSFYFYACSCVPLMDSLITQSDYHFTQGYTYGVLSCNGFLRIIPKAIQLITGNPVEWSVFTIADKYIEYFEYAKNVAPDEITNSFYSFIGNFFLDGGYVGVVLFSIVYGYVICMIYRKNAGINNAKSKVMLAFIYYAMFFSMVRCSWMNIRFAIGFLFVFLLSSNYKHRFKIRN